MDESSKNNKTCIKCDTNFIYFPNQCWWDYKGLTDTKLVKCPICGCVQAVKYKEPIAVNLDRRYYD